MNVEKTKLKTFLAKVVMTGTEMIDEMVLDFSESGLKVSAMSATNVSRVDGILKPSAFKDYKAIGKIGLDSLDTIIRVVDTFNKEITLNVEENILVLSEGNNKVEIETVDVSFITVPGESKELEFADQFELPVNILQDFIKDAEINKEYKILIESAEKKLRLTNTGKYKFKKVYDIPMAKGGIKSSFTETLKFVITNLTEKVMVYGSEDFPIKVVEKTEDSIVTILTAPNVEEE